MGDFPCSAASCEAFRSRKAGISDPGRVGGGRLHSERRIVAGVHPQPCEGKEAPGKGRGKLRSWFPQHQLSSHEFCRRAFYLHSFFFLSYIYLWNSLSAASAVANGGSGRGITERRNQA